MPTTSILLLGRTQIPFSDARTALSDPDILIRIGTNIDDVKEAFKDEARIDHVFMGAGIELEKRVDIVREVFNLSSATSVHLKEATTGPQGFLPFVKATLDGYRTT